MLCRVVFLEVKYTTRNQSINFSFSGQFKQLARCCNLTVYLELLRKCDIVLLLLYKIGYSYLQLVLRALRAAATAWLLVFSKQHKVLVSIISIIWLMVMIFIHVRAAIMSVHSSVCRVIFIVQLYNSNLKVNLLAVNIYNSSCVVVDYK